MAASLWLHLPSPPPPAAFLHHSSSSSPASPLPLRCKQQAQARGKNLLCSSSSSKSASASVVTKEHEATPAPSSAGGGEDGEVVVSEDAAVSFKDDTNFRGCKGCGREEVERGCNGEGRMQGGIAAVPGFGWWPIKAYRPCPGFVATGGRYRRYGQSMDDVIAGKGRKK